jgi:hypothetical protein
MLGPQLVVIFLKVVETLSDRSELEEEGPRSTKSLR